MRYSVSYVNCPDVKNYGNGAQVLARCALGEVNDINTSQSYLSFECKGSQGMPDNNFILTCMFVLPKYLGLIPTLNFYKISKGNLSNLGIAG